MGFTIYYESTEPVPAARASAIQAMTDEINKSKSWISCEPVAFFEPESDGRMLGGSKPSFQPHPEDIAAATADGVPDGTITDVLNALCEISRVHHVDWELSHDHSNGPIGFVRSGIADSGLIEQIDALGGVGDILADLMGDFESDIDGLSEPDDPV